MFGIKRRGKKRKKIYYFLYFIYTTVFILITTPVLLFYGPYKNVRKVFVSTLLATRHAYLLTDIFPQETLNKMTEDEKTPDDNTQNQDLSKVDITCTTGNDINLYKDEEDKYVAYILEIKNPLKIKACMTKYLGKMGQRTSEMAEDNDAAAAINGGAFTGNGGAYGGTGSEPEGFVISGGKVIYPKDKCDENKKDNVIAFQKDGKLVIGSHSIKELKEMKVQEAMCFRERNIIVDGKKQIKNHLEGGYNPRTAVGQKSDGTVIFLVIDGRKITMPGASYYDIQEIMAKRGAVNVGLLDGGYSSTMYYNGDIKNSPNAWDGERLVATAFYVEK